MSEVILDELDTKTLVLAILPKTDLLQKIRVSMANQEKHKTIPILCTVGNSFRGPEWGKNFCEERINWEWQTVTVPIKSALWSAFLSEISTAIAEMAENRAQRAFKDVLAQGKDPKTVCMFFDHIVRFIINSEDVMAEWYIGTLIEPDAEPINPEKAR